MVLLKEGTHLPAHSWPSLSIQAPSATGLALRSEILTTPLCIRTAEMIHCFRRSHLFDLTERGKDTQEPLLVDLAHGPL